LSKIRTLQDDRLIAESQADGDLFLFRMFAEDSFLWYKTITIEAVFTWGSKRKEKPYKTHYEQVTMLQKSIATSLQQPVSLKVNQVFTEQFNPLIPPTFTPSPTLIPTNTLGPSLTPTSNPTITPTLTLTPSATPTPELVQVVNVFLPPLKLFQSPGGPEIGVVRPGQILTQLYSRQELGGLIWVEVLDDEGRIGWILDLYLQLITATPNP
jgi:hypothetical protein